MERLTCYVTAEVKKGLLALGLTLSTRRGSQSEAYKLCLELAFTYPDEEFEWFVGEEDNSCSLDATADLSQRLDAYQRHHEVNERRPAFKRALLHGYALYLKGFVAGAAPN